MIRSAAVLIALFFFLLEFASLGWKGSLTVVRSKNHRGC